MGIGVSAHSLAGNVAKLGAVGTISSVDLRHHHPDLLAQAKDCKDKDALDRLNLTALDREIRMALELAAGHGAIAVNVMKAVSQYAAYVRQSCESGAHAIVMGAGVLALFAEMGLKPETTPLIVAGGIHTHAQVRALLGLPRQRTAAVRRRDPSRRRPGQLPDDRQPYSALTLAALITAA